MKRGFAIFLVVLLLTQLAFSSNTSLYVELGDTTQDDFYASLAQQISEDYDISYEQAYEIVLANTIGDDVSQNNNADENTSIDEVIIPSVQSNATIENNSGLTSDVNTSSDFVITSTPSTESQQSDLYLSLEEFTATVVNNTITFSKAVQNPIEIGESVLFVQQVELPVQDDSFYFDLGAELLKSNSSALSVYDSSFSTLLYEDGIFLSSGDIWLLDSVNENSTYTISYVLPSVIIESDCQEMSLAQALPADAQIVSSDIQLDEIVSKGCELRISQPSQVIYENITVDLTQLYNSTKMYVIESVNE